MTAFSWGSVSGWAYRPDVFTDVWQCRTVVQQKLSARGRPATEQAACAEAIRSYEKLVAEQFTKKVELATQADQDQKAYDVGNYHDDQLDLRDSLNAIAIDMLAVTALTQQRWLNFAAQIANGFGVLAGLAELLGWTIHPSRLIGLLS